MTSIDNTTMEQAREMVEGWNTANAARYLKRNVEVVLGYGVFHRGQDGYNALAMVLAYAESLRDKQVETLEDRN